MKAAEVNFLQRSPENKRTSSLGRGLNFVYREWTSDVSITPQFCTLSIQY